MRQRGDERERSQAPTALVFYGRNCQCIVQSRDDKGDSFPAIQDALFAFFFPLRIEMSHHFDLRMGSASKRYFQGAYRRGLGGSGALRGLSIALGFGLLAVSSLHARDQPVPYLGLPGVSAFPRYSHEIAAMAKPGNSFVRSTFLSYAYLHRHP